MRMLDSFVHSDSLHLDLRLHVEDAGYQIYGSLSWWAGWQPW